MSGRIDVGDYAVVSVDGKFRVIEGFGSYRMLAKKFTTEKAAVRRAQQMHDARRGNPAKEVQE